MNEIPKFPESTRALERRMVCMPCEMVINEGNEDSSIEDKLFSEVDGFVLKLIRELVKIKKEGRIKLTAVNKEYAIKCESNRDGTVWFGPRGSRKGQYINDRDLKCELADCEFPIYRFMTNKIVKNSVGIVCCGMNYVYTSTLFLCELREELEGASPLACTN